MTVLARVYHVPRSQVWGGSRGAQMGRVHLHVKPGEAFEGGRIRREDGASLCGRRGWYERDADADDETRAGLCPRCAEIAARPGALVTGLL